METIWSYLTSLGYIVTPRDEKHTVHLALESEKLNGAQKKRMPDMMWVTEKLDGVYSLVTVIYDETGTPTVRHWGRSGKAQSNCEALDALVESRIKSARIVKKDFILISEVTSDNPLAELSGYLTPSRVNEAVVIPENLEDNFHDIISVDEFIKGESEETLFYRLVTLDNFIYDTKLKVVPNYDMQSFVGAQTIAETIIYPRGGEGLICNNVHSKWIAGARNETMIKIKEKLSFDVTVVGMCSGKEGSKYENTLGKLVVVFSKHANPTMSDLVEVPISGMTDANRDKWWCHPEEIIGLTVKMDAKSYTATGNLREPRFKEVRHDKESQFPVGIVGIAPKEFTKGKANWKVWNWSK